MKRSFLIFILICMFSLLVFSQEQLNLTITSNQLLQTISREVLIEAYKRIGVDAKFTVLPSKRALSESNTGKFDGETQRIKGINSKFTNLVLVDVPINSVQQRAYSKKHNLYIDSSDKLKGYKLGIRRGVLMVENYTKDLNVDVANDNESNMKKALAGRIDFVIMTDLDGALLLKQQKYSSIKMMEPALLKSNLYHYLHKSKSSLVPKIEKVLQEMLTNGDIEKIRNRVIDSFKK